jgi:cell division protein FtsB
MSSVRGRRGGTPPPGSRSTGRAPRVHTTRPVNSGRAVLLVALVLLLALTLAGPVRQYLAGQQELVALSAEGEALDRRAAELEAQLERQDDEEWVARQARERLTYVLPGDRLIITVDGEAVEGDAGTLDEAATTAEPLTWYEGLMESVARADGDRAEESDE